MKTRNKIRYALKTQNRCIKIHVEVSGVSVKIILYICMEVQLIDLSVQ